MEVELRRLTSLDMRRDGEGEKKAGHAYWIKMKGV